MSPERISQALYPIHTKAHRELSTAALVMGIPCVAATDDMEGPVTVDKGTNVTAGTKKVNVREAIRRQLDGCIGATIPKYWDGRADVRIVDILIYARSTRKSSQQTLIAQPCD